MSLNQSGTTTINTLSPLQAMSGQVPAEWQNRVQVLPQTIQNAPYLQQLYTGQPVVMTGIPGIGGQQQIQLIAACKTYFDFFSNCLLKSSQNFSWKDISKFTDGHATDDHKFTGQASD